MLRRVGWDAPRWPPLSRFIERCFDRRFGVETADVVLVPQLDIDHARKPLSQNYVPSRAMDMAWVLAGLNIDFSQFTFVDVGSGKGRGLIVADQFPFRRIVGVELSPTLHSIALTNIARLPTRHRRSGRIQSLNLDAVSFAFPDDPLVVYMFHPFKGPIMERVLENLRVSLERMPRPVFVVYQNPVWREAVDHCEWLTHLRDVRAGFGFAVYGSDATAAPSTSPTVQLCKFT